MGSPTYQKQRRWSLRRNGQQVGKHSEKGGYTSYWRVTHHLHGPSICTRRHDAIRQLIESHCYRAAIWLASLHPSHPLYKTTHRAARSYPKRHPSPLDNVLHIGEIKPHTLESIDPRPRHPHWIPPFVTSIPSTKEEACQAELDDEADIQMGPGKTVTSGQRQSFTTESESP